MGSAARLPHATHPSRCSPPGLPHRREATWHPLMPFARFESTTCSLCSLPDPPFIEPRHALDAPRSVGPARRPSGRPGALRQVNPRCLRSEERQHRISARPRAPRALLPEPRSRRPSPRRCPARPRPLSERSVGPFNGLRAHLPAPKSSSANPTHLRSPRRPSVSSSLPPGR